MKISSTKRAAILATVLGGCILGHSAEAAMLGAVTASNYGTSHLGAIQGSYINSDDIKAIESVIKDLNGDPAVFNTVDPITGISSMFIRQYTYSTTELKNSVVFNPQGKWSEVIEGKTSAAANAHDVVRYNDFVYVASYDEGTIGVGKVTDTAINDKTAFTRNLKEDLQNFENIEFGDKAQLHGEGMVIIGNNLYVMANVNPQGGYTPYDPSYLIKYTIQDDGSLSYDRYVVMGKNTDSVALNVYNNHIFSTAIGGYQNYGDAGINKETSLNYATINENTGKFVTTNRNEANAIVVPENVNSEFRSLKIMPNGTAYVMTYNLGDAGYNVNLSVYKTTVSNLLSQNPENWQKIYSDTGATGWFGSLDAEYNTNRLWVQVGNQLKIFTDGGECKTFDVKDFTTSDIYKELYTWAIINTDVIPESKLVELKLANGTSKAVSDKVVTWNEKGGNVDQIKNVSSATGTGLSNATISLGKDATGNLTNNILAGIYADNISTLITANNMQVQVENNVATPVGIYAGNKGSINYIDGSGKLNILTKSMESGNTLTNAIWLDPSATGGESITINTSETNITMEGGYGGNGVAITKTDRWGENSKESTQGGTITINGDLNIKGAADKNSNATWGIGANPTNVISRFNNAGIFVDVNNSDVMVKGNVDMDVYGNGVTVNGTNSTITLAKGGSITVPTGTEYGYYTLAAYDGTINMNMGADGNTIGENTVKLDGDIFAIKGANINLGLATADSYLNGIIDSNGTVNLTLQKGATWNNVANNSRYYQDNEDFGYGENSRVTKLTGADTLANAGTIVQGAESGYIRIDNLKGAVNVAYSHDAADPTKILGGSITIVNATEDSQVGMFTDSTNIATDNDEQVKAVLSKLANKLYYTGYEVEDNITGIVGIKEGLTSTEVKKQVELQFTTSGQGSIDGNATPGEGESEGPAPDAPVVPPSTGGEVVEREPFEPVPLPFDENKTPTPNQGTITPEGATIYGAVNLNENRYWEPEDDYSVILVGKEVASNAGNNIVAGVYAVNSGTSNYDYCYPYSPYLKIEVENDNARPVGAYLGGDASHLYIDEDEKDNLHIVTKMSKDSTMRTNAIWLDPTISGGKQLKIINASGKGTINVVMSGGYGGNGVAITRDDGSKECTSGSTIKIGGNLVLRGEYDNQWGIVANPKNFNARTNNAGILVNVNNSSVKVEGIVDMTIYGNGITVDADGASVIVTNDNNFDGGYIIVPQGTCDGENSLKYYSLAAYNGSIDLGTVSSLRNSQINGDIYISGEKDADNESKASVSLKLSDSNAYLKGAVVNEGGNANLYFYEGATWYNTSTNGDTGVVSHLTNLGGSNGNIIQSADSGDILIDNYSGSTKFMYTYDANDPTDIKGGSVVITNSKNGNITMQVPFSEAINASNLQTVMKSLANKLYYKGYIYETNAKGYYFDSSNNYLDSTDGNVYKDVKKDDGTVEQVVVGNIYDGYVFTPIHIDREGSLNATVQIAEGLVTSSVKTQILDESNNVIEGIGEIKVATGQKDNAITYDQITDTLNAGIRFNETTGQGSLTGNFADGTGAYEGGSVVEAPFIDASGAYNRPIYGVAIKDIDYVKANITSGDGVYNFNDALTVINTSNKTINGGAWHTPVAMSISSYGKGNVTTINMKNNNLILNNKGDGAAICAIDGGEVIVNNPNSIIINEQGYISAAVFANSGGKVLIDNADGGVVTLNNYYGGGFSGGSNGAHGAGIKTMNGVADVRSEVVITGLVDIVADLQKCTNEGISAVASTVEVGGGNIQAINGAWCAIRAYGEFVSANKSIVNVNVVKDEAGNIIGAGDNKTTIYGDFVTNGGMGTKGNISVGLSGKDSYWTGNYADTRGYGVTKGMEGNVDLYMKDGAKWTGFNDGEMNVTMDGEGTTWYGFNVAERQADGAGNINGGLTLTLTNGALWQNAISTEQKDSNGNQVTSKVYRFIGDGGFVDMTGAKTFLAVNSANHAEGSNGTSYRNSHIVEHDAYQYQTGDLVINNYSGNTTIIYAHDKDNPTNILGGDTTIKSASAGSNITLSTDNAGIKMDDKTQVSNVLDKLANKLYYSAYVNNERNLQGKVQIAEGLTTSSIGKHVGEIKFSTANGQGSLKDGSLKLNVDQSSGDENQGENKPEEKPVEPEKIEVSFANGITGGSAVAEYDDVVQEDGSYDFSKLEGDNGEVVGSVKVEVQKSDADNANNSAILSAATDKPVVIEMGGKDLSIGTSASGKDAQAHGIQAEGADVTIKGAGGIKIQASATGEGGVASAIYASGNNVTIDNKGIVKLIATDGAGAVLQAENGAIVDIGGAVEIEGTKDKVAVKAEGAGTIVAIGGGEINGTTTVGDKDNVAIHVDGGQVNINVDGDESVVINGKIVLGKAPTKAKLLAGKPKTMPTGSSLTLSDSDSRLNDDVHYAGAGDNKFAIAITDGATWTGNSTGGVALDVSLDDGGIWKGYHEDGSNAALNLDINDGAVWANTAGEGVTTKVTSLRGTDGVVQMSTAKDSDLEIASYEGNNIFYYQHSQEKPSEILGGTVTIKNATEGSIVNVRTNSIGTSEQKEVEKVLNALAQKLAYKDYGNAPDNLKGVVQILEGMTTSGAMRTGDIVFDANGNGSLKGGSVSTEYTGDYIYGDSETAMMKGAKSAMASTVMMWRSESNDLLQRMGDVRLATEESGVWAKYYGGKYEMDAQNTNFTTNYKAYQVGYDKAVGNGWNVGVAVSHNEGDSRYDRGGEGEMTVTSLSVYGNKDYGDGRYLGLILKGSQLKNEYEVFNNDGYKLEGDFKTWGTSISAEYGKRIEKGNAFYFDPSVELTVGHVQGKDYTATSDMLAAYGKTATMQVEQDDFNSIIGRVGFGIGQRTDKASYYAKLALAHEFGGAFDTHYTAEETKGTNIDFGDTWYEMQLGGTAKLSDNSLLYATYERSFGGDVTEKWRVDAGLRVTF